ncbi:hypothetical protein [Planktothrix sp.]|uniref:hypothetical protein n=1 Tax=Planktothrix sp. TaxID=3088171 RepID=UPI0038D3EF63
MNQDELNGFWLACLVDIFYDQPNGVHMMSEHIVIMNSYYNSVSSETKNALTEYAKELVSKLNKFNIEDGQNENN